MFNKKTFHNPHTRILRCCLKTDYFIGYLRSVTGRCKRHIDAWFLSHPTWVYENTNGNLKTFETRAWVEAPDKERDAILTRLLETARPFRADMR